MHAALALQVSTGTTAIVALGVVAVILIFLLLLASRYVKVGPNEALIVSGLRGRSVADGDGKPRHLGFRWIKGGGTFVFPVVERAETLSLELMTLDVKTPEVYSVTGVPLVVDGVAQVKIRGDDTSIVTASEQFLGKTPTQIAEVAHQTIEGHLRAIIGTLTVEEIYKNREMFSQKVQEIAATDLANMGLQVVSFVVKDIKDNQGYLDALGRPRIAQVKRDAIIAQAEADRDSMIKSAQANQAGMEAKFAADTKVAESNRDFEMKRADYQAGINEKKANADLAYDLQKYKTGQLVKAEEIQVLTIEKEKQIEVQEKEILRREKELDATVKKPAEAERFRIQTLAEAEQFKLKAEADGQSEATKSIGFGEAEATRARGLAGADVVRATGESEALAMAKKAESWKAYTEAAITQILLEKLPEIARAIAEPLSKTEKIVIVSTGGETTGASKLTADVAKVISQLPPTIEALSGVRLGDLIDKVRGGSRGGDTAAPPAKKG